ncbi:MAG: hypothetical protein FJ096_12260 [Deltaproteobacteria bacterium]|nr:hypothetical protein [Deltaproteobacteria bacterium]
MTRRTQHDAASSHDICPPSKSRVGLRRADATSGYDFETDAVRETSARIAVDGSWFEVGGVRGDISRRPVLRRVLAALVAHLAEGQARPLTMQEVLAAGWPNERCVRDSGAARVYQTIKRLRQVGLGSLLDHDGRGYWLKGSPAIASVERTGDRATAA